MADIQTTETAKTRALAMLDHEQTQLKLAQLLPDEKKRERFVAIAATQTITNPALAGCDPRSVMSAILKCASLGLMPSGLLGEAYILPFKDQATMIVGYRGLEKLARATGLVDKFWSAAVFKGDHWVPPTNPFEIPEHTADLERKNAPKWGDLICAFAVAFMRDDSVVCRVVPFWEIERAREAANSKNSPAWKTYPDRMARKTAIRRLCSEIQSTSEFDHSFVDVLAREEHSEAGVEDHTPRDAEFEEIVTAVADQVIAHVEGGSRRRPKGVEAKLAARAEAAGRSPALQADSPTAQEAIDASDDPEAAPDREALLAAAERALSCLEDDWLIGWADAQLDVGDATEISELSTDHLARLLADAEGAMG